MFEGVVEDMKQSVLISEQLTETKPRLNSEKAKIVCPLCDRVYDSERHLRRHLDLISRVTDST
jgi:hypothetical protein